MQRANASGQGPSITRRCKQASTTTTPRQSLRDTWPRPTILKPARLLKPYHATATKTHSDTGKGRRWDAASSSQRFPYWLPRVSASNGDDRDFVIVRQANHLFAIEHQGFAGGDAETCGAGFEHGFDRRHTNNGHIEPHVLIRLCNLHNRQSLLNKVAGTTNRFVCSFHRLDRDTRFSTHHDRLAQIQPRNLASDLQTVFDILALVFIRLASRQRTSLRQILL